MFWDFNYERYGFTRDEWDLIPRGDRVIIRDYILNRHDREDTLLYDEYQTVHQVRKVEKQYELENRPIHNLDLSEFTFY